MDEVKILQKKMGDLLFILDKFEQSLPALSSDAVIKQQSNIILKQSEIIEDVTALLEKIVRLNG